MSVVLSLGVLEKTNGCFLIADDYSFVEDGVYPVVHVFGYEDEAVCTASVEFGGGFEYGALYFVGQSYGFCTSL